MRQSLSVLIGLLSASLLVLGGCVSPSTQGERYGAPVDGFDRYTLSTGLEKSSSGCHFSYRRFVPDVPAAETYLIGHGFLRNQRTMSGLAAALARAGYTAVTLEFCNMHWWNGNHESNAADMRALAAQLGVKRPVYVGFSAGALAALLAARKDDTAVGLVTLDLVDQNGMGSSAADGLDIPWLALHGEASSCNADNNASTAYGVARTLDVIRIPNASHCEFESPSNWLCERFCGDRETPRVDDEQRNSIIGLVVSNTGRFARVVSKSTDNFPATLYLRRNKEK